MTASALLVGFGSVGRHLAQLLNRLKDPPVQLNGVSDSCGAVFCNTGLDLTQLLKHKAAGHSVATFQQSSKGDIIRFGSTEELLAGSKYDVLFEASPVDLKTCFRHSSLSP